MLFAIPRIASACHVHKKATWFFPKHSHEDFSLSLQALHQKYYLKKNQHHFEFNELSARYLDVDTLLILSLAELKWTCVCRWMIVRYLCYDRQQRLESRFRSGSFPRLEEFILLRYYKNSWFVSWSIDSVVLPRWRFVEEIEKERLSFFQQSWKKGVFSPHMKPPGLRNVQESF